MEKYHPNGQAYCWGHTVSQTQFLVYILMNSFIQADTIKYLMILRVLRKTYQMMHCCPLRLLYLDTDQIRAKSDCQFEIRWQISVFLIECMFLGTLLSLSVFMRSIQ